MRKPFAILFYTVLTTRVAKKKDRRYVFQSNGDCD